MSGHSKWSTIKRQKGLADARRSSIFSKLARQISLAAREGKDPATNFRLRLAIDRARAANLPNDNVERAVKAGTGELKEQTKEVWYEGFGPAGVAVMIQAVTDNTNRTAADLRALFARFGGSLGATNSVAWMFRRRGIIRLPLNQLSHRRSSVELQLIDVGAEDVREENGQLVIETDPARLPSVKGWLASQGLAAAAADIEFVPDTTATINEPGRQKLQPFFDALEAHDDVTDFYSNEV
ncbi:MAG: YebC/PmpR family DNA-binding transcriptional regulator [Candidatus Kerfeldbacteria bacterium]|nr:YebC/PmpR family DNA-binding transcriptional regulator [Candidatus Kerfeldbacteria bacterium]